MLVGLYVRVYYLNSSVSNYTFIQTPTLAHWHSIGFTRGELVMNSCLDPPRHSTRLIQDLGQRALCKGFDHLNIP